MSDQRNNYEHDSWMQDEALLDRLIEDVLAGSDAGIDDAGDVSVARGELERAVGSVDAAYAAFDEALPSSVRAGLEALADRFVSEGDAAEVDGGLKLAGTAAAQPSAASSVGGTAGGGLSIGAWSGWIAAAACLGIAAVSWFGAGTVEDAGQSGQVVQVASLEEQVESMKGRETAVYWDWLGLDDVELADSHAKDQELRGEVVWDEATGQGFLVFEGLAANDPTVEQYQLWIFDAERRIGDLPQFAIEGFPDILTQRPVDGGVFDAGDGKTIIPIDAKIPVGKPMLFAVTLEEPGGVVVSDRDIVTLAVRPS